MLSTNRVNRFKNDIFCSAGGLASHNLCAFSSLIALITYHKKQTEAYSKGRSPSHGQTWINIAKAK